MVHDEHAFSADQPTQLEWRKVDGGVHRTRKGHECCDFVEWSAASRCMSAVIFVFPSRQFAYIPTFPHCSIILFSLFNSSFVSLSLTHSFTYSRHDSQRHGREARFRPVSSPNPKRTPMNTRSYKGDINRQALSPTSLRRHLYRYSRFVLTSSSSWSSSSSSLSSSSSTTASTWTPT